VLDLLYDRYLLMGDQRSFENMRVAAGHGAYFAIGSAPKPGADKVGGSLGRSQGWSLRTLARYYDLTGDKRAGEPVKEAIKAYEPLIGKAPLWFANDELAHASDWFTHIFTRGMAMIALATGDPKAIEICKSLAEGKEKPSAGSITYGKQTPTDAKYFSTLFAVLYHLTGEQKYNEPLGGGWRMRWRVPGAQAMLGLRAVYVNDDWDGLQRHRIKQERRRLYPYRALVQRIRKNAA